MKSLLSMALIALLAACAHDTLAPPLQSYDMSKVAVRADAQGWYSFGDTRFKGAVVNGAPDGNGMCIVKGEGPRETPCSFSRGVRTDAAYVETKRTQLAQETAANLDQERRDRIEREGYERQRIREQNQAVAEANASMAAYMQQLPNKMKNDMARVDAASRGTSVEEEQAKARRNAEFQALIAKQAADPNSDMNRDKRARESAEAKRKADDKRRDDDRNVKRDADRKIEIARNDKSAADMRKPDSADSGARSKDAGSADARAKQEAADNAAAAKVAAEKAAAEKAATSKAAAEARKAQQEADKKAQVEAKARAEADYLQQLGAKTRLTAKSCYGEQHAMGQLPSIKPQVVSCVDIHFRAYCPGTAPSQAYQGAIKNMIGMGTGCFGDTAEIKPKLSCKADEIRVDVVRAASCS